MLLFRKWTLFSSLLFCQSPKLQVTIRTHHNLAQARPGTHWEVSRGQMGFLKNYNQKGDHVRPQSTMLSPLIDLYLHLVHLGSL